MILGICWLPGNDQSFQEHYVWNRLLRTTTRKSWLNSAFCGSQSVVIQPADQRKEVETNIVQRNRTLLAFFSWESPTTTTTTTTTATTTRAATTTTTTARTTTATTAATTTDSNEDAQSIQHHFWTESVDSELIVIVVYGHWLRSIHVLSLARTNILASKVAKEMCFLGH